MPLREQIRVAKVICLENVLKRCFEFRDIRISRSRCRSHSIWISSRRFNSRVKSSKLSKYIVLILVNYPRKNVLPDSRSGVNHIGVIFVLNITELEGRLASPLNRIAISRNIIRQPAALSVDVVVNFHDELGWIICHTHSAVVLLGITKVATAIEVPLVILEFAVR